MFDHIAFIALRIPANRASVQPPEHRYPDLERLTAAVESAPLARFRRISLAAGSADDGGMTGAGQVKHMIGVLNLYEEFAHDSRR